MPLYLHTILSFLSCFGFGILFNVEKRTLFLAAVNGSIGWTILMAFDNTHISYIFANLLSALVVGILAEIFAIVKKTPATGFIVIGVIPLVPGFRVYRSMLFFVRGDLDQGLTEGVKACFMAIAIAVGIILATSITRMIRQHISLKH
ncbi:MAG: threonine/serine exporter family protein [Treponema sp.]|uniref:threonine/serine exporter family protein n=1 Tax=Treponema sp. TaxID=166 RepID=UPI003FA2DCEE